jgi:hypothetical protein
LIVPFGACGGGLYFGALPQGGRGDAGVWGDGALRSARRFGGFARFADASGLLA